MAEDRSNRGEDGLEIGRNGRLDAGDNWYFVPSMAMFSNVVMRKK